MAADIFGIGETCLQEGETVHFDGYRDFTASHGNGKGVAVFSKMESTNRPVVNSVSSSIFSAIQYRAEGFDVIFLYWSQFKGCMLERGLECKGAQLGGAEHFLFLPLRLFAQLFLVQLVLILQLKIKI